MDRKSLFVLRVLISSGYCMIVAGLVAIFSEITLSSAMFIGAFVVVVIGAASFSNGKSIVPIIAKQENASSIDANSIRVSIETNTQVAKAEKNLKFREESQHINKPDIMMDLFIRITGVEMIVGAVIVAAIAFIPYLKYY